MTTPSPLTHEQRAKMSAVEVELIALSCADMARCVGARIRLDFWKLRNLGLSQTEIARIKNNLGETVDYDWPHT